MACSLKRTYDKGEAHMPRMMVTAYATHLRLALASLEAEGGSEVETALALISLIDLKGHIVTADALHCHRGMVEVIVAKGGDYCFTLKGNREGLLSDARACLSKAGNRHPTAKVRDGGSRPRRDACRHRRQGTGYRRVPTISQA
jgi:predicted transposase YbfD/YdcC